MVYDAEERNEADGHFFVQTRRGTAFRAICFVARLAKGIDHSLRPASRISSRKAGAAAPRGFSTACYVRRIVERLVAAIEPDAAGGEPPLMPRLNRYKPIGATGEVNFKTTRPCVPTIRSHIDQVVADTRSWEQAAVFRLEQASGVVDFYARNDHLELSVPYEYLGVAHSYFPDFVVRLKSGTTLLLEIKGEEQEKDRAKHQAARRWVSAVNHWGQLGHWTFHACRDPQRLSQELTALLAIPSLTHS